MRTRCFRLTAFICAVAALTSCGGGTPHERQIPGSPHELPERSLPLPKVPDDITDVTERADYVALHFWDSLDFTDKAAMRDTAFVEQSFSNYISILPICGDEGIRQSVQTLMGRAKAAGESVFILEIAEKYLWESDSPFRSERSFRPFVEYAVSAVGNGRERYEALLDDIRKNAPGSRAPGFTVTDRDGRKMTFTPSELKTRTILMFYEPDCEQCKSTISQLMADETFNTKISKGELRFIAVYVGEEKEMWEKQAFTLPPDWQVCIDDLMEIDDRDLYLIRATPSFYVIEAGGTVLVKDGTLHDLSF